MTPLITFGKALELLKQGKIVARQGWSSKNMSIWLAPKITLLTSECKDDHLKQLAIDNGGSISCLASIRFRNAEGRVLLGWTATQSDLLAEDWVEVL